MALPRREMMISYRKCRSLLLLHNKSVNGNDFSTFLGKNGIGFCAKFVIMEYFVRLYVTIYCFAAYHYLQLFILFVGWIGMYCIRNFFHQRNLTAFSIVVFPQNDNTNIYSCHWLHFSSKLFVLFLGFMCGCSSNSNKNDCIYVNFFSWAHAICASRKFCLWRISENWIHSFRESIKPFSPKCH